MMRLDRLAALVATVAPDRTSTVADAAAARWALPAGTARYVRTSATYVFAAGDGYLRLRPTAEARVEEAEAVASAATALSQAGAPVVPALVSASGRLCEVLALRDLPDLPGVDVHATLVAAAPGRSKKLDELDELDAVRWGRALGRLHQTGRTVERTGLPAWPEVIRRSIGPSCHPRLADIVDDLIERCTNRLGPPSVLVHGDAQPDNAGWTASGPTLFDLDDACVSWAAADLAMAVRDAQPIDVLDTPATDSPAGQALLLGYRQQATLDPEEEQLVPLLQRLTAALTYARLRAATNPDSVTDSEPDWLRTLRVRLSNIADQLLAALLRPDTHRHPAR